MIYGFLICKPKRYIIFIITFNKKRRAVARRFFKELVGKTPIDYLNFYRIERACEMLISGEKNITETAFECGFNDISYFIKTFKKYKGIPPKQYISSIKK